MTKKLLVIPADYISSWIEKGEVVGYFSWKSDTIDLEDG